jgi:hypothetical protein
MLKRTTFEYLKREKQLTFNLNAMKNLETKNQLKCDNGNALEAFEKVSRKINAEKFIKELNKKFNEIQTNNLINLLSDYEKFLKLND